MAVPLSQFTKSQNSPLRFQPVDQSERQKLAQQGQEVQRFREQRQKLESQVAARPAEQPAKPLAPATGRLPLSPIVARPNAELGKDHVPPQMHVAPKPDLTVEAKPRATPSPEQPQPRTVNRLPLDTPQPQPNRSREPSGRAPQPQPKAERRYAAATAAQPSTEHRSLNPG